MKIQKNYFADISLAIVAIIWGSGFVALDIALKAGIKPFLTMAIRFSIASIILGAIFYKKLRLLNKKNLKSGIIIGLFLFGGFATQTAGLQYTTPSKNAFITGVNVVIVPFLYWILSKKRPDIYSFIAAVMCCLGIGFLTLDSVGGINIGDVLTLFCAVLFAMHISAVGHYSKDNDPIVLTIVQMIVAAVLSIVCAIFVEKPPATFTTDSIFAVVYLGVFCTCIAFLIQNIAQKYTSTTKTAIILSTESVFGTILAVLIIGDDLTGPMVIGCIIIFCGIIISETKLSFLKPQKTGISRTK